MKAATLSVIRNRNVKRISIHAAREGGDFRLPTLFKCALLFQSTPPVKAATELPDFKFSGDVFQSTPPVKAATIV